MGWERDESEWGGREMRLDGVGERCEWMGWERDDIGWGGREMRVDGVGER